MTPPPPRIKLRLAYGPGLTLGYGKADLLDAIARHGSISAAGRAMGMSYRRAWALVAEMNDAFAAPLVDSSRGGAGGGRAALTTTGQQVLAHFRAIEAHLATDPGGDLAAIAALLRD